MTDHHSLRARLFHILHKPSRSNALTRHVNYFLAAVILINCIAVALETVPAIAVPNKLLFHVIEVVSTSLFIVEYLLRLWVSVEQGRFNSPIAGRLRYALEPLSLLDLLVILTFWAPWDLRFLRIFRLTRLLRVLNLEELDHSFKAISNALARRKHLLIVAILLMVITAYCFAALLYLIEHQVQPDKFSSIPETLWWAIVTLTTIGYGDMTPITPIGKLLSGAIVLVGIGIFALPTAIMTAAILDAGTDRHQKNCPHCGGDVNQS
ncbi:ion transporter [Undibacterium pigrum]|uniref:Voltage-gated potassium channel n=1 Tax=Undibacterium pigrum TaxID=401470 RepID=A0A318JKC4_9BURK|nr:ion transporter [Undibacterium pigrum]PXX44184.1 voltage-gated potassium channel [Undibacterium pigrum]